MTDAKLLELAARAHGDLERVPDMGWIHVDANGKRGAWWSPLRDDGDALRLAVILALEVYHSINNDRWTVFVGYPKDQRIVYVMEEYGDDEYAATRRAIVRAAAEIGRSQHG